MPMMYNVLRATNVQRHRRESVFLRVETWVKMQKRKELLD